METADSELFLDEYGPLCKKIRVLHVAETAGAVDTYLKILLRYSSSDRIENILVCSKDYDIRDYRGLTDSVERIHMERTDSVLEEGRSIRKLREIIGRYSPDIVYAHSYRAGMLLRIADIGIRNRVLYNPHGWSYNRLSDPDRRNRRLTAEKMLALFTDMVICGSVSEKMSAIKLGIVPEKKLIVIPEPTGLHSASEHFTYAIRSDGKKMTEQTEELYERLVWDA
ncbi:MAG: glycosyltransferase [Lachnospiraceae bacterium]|nr:glycosyltransferase [Lachnospiraceae bacterium]